MKRIIAIILSLTIALSTPIYTNANVYEGSLLKNFNPISKPNINFALIKQIKGDKIVIYNSENVYNEPGWNKYGLVNLKGEILLDTKYDYIEIDEDNNIKVSYDSKKRIDTYDEHMILIDSRKVKKINTDFSFQKYSNELSNYTAFKSYTTIDSSSSENKDVGIIEIYNELSLETIKTISIDIYEATDHYSKGYDLRVLRYCKEINAFDCLASFVPDSGYVPYYHLSCFDLDGNDVFKNDLGVKVYAYIGDGYYFYEENGKKGIAILPGFKEKKVEKILRKPAATKIKKIWKKKKSSKKLKLSMQKVTNANGYYIKVYSSKKNAKKDKKALLSKKTKKTTITLKSKKLKKKKALYVKVRTYNQLGSDYMWSKWSAIKKVKIK